MSRAGNMVGSFVIEDRSGDVKRPWTEEDAARLAGKFQIGGRLTRPHVMTPSGPYVIWCKCGGHLGCLGGVAVARGAASTRGPCSSCLARPAARRRRRGAGRVAAVASGVSTRGDRDRARTCKVEARREMIALLEGLDVAAIGAFKLCRGKDVVAWLDAGSWPE